MRTASSATFVSWALVVALAPLSAGAQATSIPASASTTGTITGTVYDSVARAPLRGVLVELVKVDDGAQMRGFSATSDSVGRYSITGVPIGRYLAGFFNIASDTLGIEPNARAVIVGPGSQRVDLTIPSARTVVSSLCPSSTPADSTGLLMGHVRRSETALPADSASVVVEWTETTLRGVIIEEETRRVIGETKGAGWFAICGLPSDVMLSVRASRGADSSGYIAVDVPLDGLRHVTMHVGGATLVPLPRPARRSGEDSTTMPAQTVLRGRARLAGTVRDHKGKPVSNARALVWGTNLEAVTNDRGTFVLDSLPGGTHTLEVRHLGHAPTQAIVHLAAERPATSEIALAERPAVLNTVTVRSQLAYSRNLADFDARRLEGWELVGQFLGPADLEKRPNTRLSSLVQEMQGVYVDNRRGGGSVRMRTSGNANSYCTPSLYVDGVRQLDADFNAFGSDRIAAIEVYPREAGRPSEFMDANACGSIIVWTRTPVLRMKGPPS